jgi:hypothetical protein
MGVVLVTYLLAAVAACAGADDMMLDASAFESRSSTPRAFLEINQTCFRLCQLDKLPASQGNREPALSNPTAAPAQTPSSEQYAGGSGKGVTLLLSNPSSSGGPSRSDVTLRSPSATAAGARRLLSNTTTTATTTNSSTQVNTSSAGAVANITVTSASTNSTATPGTSLAPTTACAALDPGAQALLAKRYRGFKIHLALSDFWELFYSLGNLVYAIDDLLKQGLSSIATGKVQINAESILQFNMNMASITAWWGNLVQNLLLLSSDVVNPSPTDTAPQ